MKTSVLFAEAYRYATNPPPPAMLAMSDDDLIKLINSGEPIRYDDGTVYNFVQVHQGGTSSGKTYSILQCLFVVGASEERLTITVVGQDIPNLKAGALRDALNIWHDNPEIKKAWPSYNKSDRIFTSAGGSIMEFKSYDGYQDAKSGKRDYLFVNEANGIAYDIYNEQAMRTKRKVFIDYNPNAGFWVHDMLLGKPGVQLVISDHRQNPFIDAVLRAKIEALRVQDLELWKVYGRGLTGKIEGLVLKNWTVCKDSEFEEAKTNGRFLAYGLDFGFTNDQSGLVEVYLYNAQLWVNELLYETEMTNTDLSARFHKLKMSVNREIIADSAEPKSIEELKRLGWYISGAYKPKDSITNGIDILKRFHINVARKATNLRMELGRYTWKKDKTGKVLNVPVDGFNHLIDPLRYVALAKLAKAPTNKVGSRMPWKQGPQPGNSELDGLL